MPVIRWHICWIWFFPVRYNKGEMPRACRQRKRTVCYMHSCPFITAFMDKSVWFKIRKCAFLPVSMLP